MRSLIKKNMDFYFGYCNVVMEKEHLMTFLEDLAGFGVDGITFMHAYLNVKKDTDEEGGFWLDVYIGNVGYIEPLFVNCWIKKEGLENIKKAWKALFDSYEIKNVCPCFSQLYFDFPPLTDKEVLGGLPY